MSIRQPKEGQSKGYFYEIQYDLVLKTEHNDLDPLHLKPVRDDINARFYRWNTLCTNFLYKLPTWKTIEKQVTESSRFSNASQARKLLPALHKASESGLFDYEDHTSGRKNTLCRYAFRMVRVNYDITTTVIE